MSVGSNRNRGTTPQQQKTYEPLVSCNRCERPLATSLYVCGCCCVFCEECTVDHFYQNQNCPNCGRCLTDKDFMQLVITDPVAPSTDSFFKPSFQSLFSKKTSSVQYVKHSEMLSQVMQQMNCMNKTVFFGYKQLLELGEREGERCGRMRRMNETLQQEMIQIQQSFSAEKLELQKTIDGLQNQLQAARKQLDEKDNMLNKFRQIHGGMMITPQSSHGNKSPSATMTATIPVSSHSHRTTSYNNQRSQTSQQPSSTNNPLQGYLDQRAATDRAKQQALQSHLNGGLDFRRNGNGHTNHLSGVTPIQLPRRHSPAASVVIPGTPRIRDISSSSGYVFTSRANQDRHLSMSHQNHSSGTFGRNHDSKRYGGY